MINVVACRTLKQTGDDLWRRFCLHETVEHSDFFLFMFRSYWLTYLQVLGTIGSWERL